MPANKGKEDLKSESGEKTDKDLHREERSASGKSDENFENNPLSAPQSYGFKRIRKDGVRTNNPHRKQKVATQDFILKRPNQPPKNRVL